MHLRKYLDHGLIFLYIFILLFLSSFMKLSAYEINWIEVANTGKEKQLIESKDRVFRFHRGEPFTNLDTD